MAGYAVVDVETTGLFPGAHDRIVEIAVVHVDPGGAIEESWTTLLNPGRDLGPQHVHGISAADVLSAPTFAQVAGDLADRLAGRTFVAHNAHFDRRFVHTEFASAGWDVPITADRCLCTMQWAGRLLPGAPRALAGCCSHLGIPLTEAHTALADATATAHLLGAYLGIRDPAPWHDVVVDASSTPWPPIARQPFTAAQRGAARSRQVPFLKRLADRLPSAGDTLEQEQYLALLDRALLDRFLSVREQDGLVSLAVELGIDRATARDLHVGYYEALARVAWADGLLSDDEKGDLNAVGALLGLDQAEMAEALIIATAEVTSGATGPPTHRVTTFRLRPGDLVVFTGDMAVPRETWMERAQAVGLVPWSGVTKKVALVVAADPDSLSGKARKAADYGIPIVTEQAFEQMLATLTT
ncbi:MULTISPECIES: exonuclease domain-containing protein [unclassified Actinotalea]|uniref:exonuclease domain-containing protein n=1 Tax=unclassified Actinotalea TaxID=2638618 RepID=UPI0015F61990|nr:MULTISPECIES: exonuclease domain-containing protein [unclassified Actinotalea]